MKFVRIYCKEKALHDVREGLRVHLPPGTCYAEKGDGHYWRCCCCKRPVKVVER